MPQGWALRCSILVVLGYWAFVLIRLALAGEPENGMDVVGHNHKGIQLHAWEPLRQCLPGLVQNGTQLGMLKNRVVCPSIDRHKIRSGLRIVIAREALGLPAIGVLFPRLLLR